MSGPADIQWRCGALAMLYKGFINLSAGQPKQYFSRLQIFSYLRLIARDLLLKLGHCHVHQSKVEGVNHVTFPGREICYLAYK